MKKYFILFMLVACSSALFSQQIIKGKITDAAMQPVIDATIYIPVVQSGTHSDSTGSFELNIANEKEVTLQVSHLGFKTILIKVNSNEELKITLEKSATDISEVVISSSGEKLPENYPYPIQVYSKEKLDKTGGITLMSKLAYQPGIDKISTGTGIGKPVIRGNSFNRIVLHALGTRIENQQWDDRHDLGIPEAGVERVEVIQGPSALIYGADALGGALVFIDEKPADVGKSTGSAVIGYNANNNGSEMELGYKSTTGSGLFFIARAAASLNGSYKQGGEETPGHDKFAANSKFVNATGKLALGMTKKWGVSRLNLSYYKQLTGIVELEPAGKVEDEGEQKNYDIEAPYQDVASEIISWQNTIYLRNSNLYADVAYQLNDRKEFEPLNNGIKKAKYKSIGLKLNVITYDIKWVSNASKKTGVTIGTQGMSQQNKNNGIIELVPDANVSDFAAYITGRYDMEKINFLGGIRADLRAVSIDSRLTEDSIQFPVNAVDKDYKPVSGSLGMSWNPIKPLHIKVNVASGFSAPNYAEMGTYGRHEGAYRFEIGNPDLKMEENVEADLGINYAMPELTLFADGFYNAVKNYIFLQNSGSFNDALPVYNFIQDDALLLGGSAGFAFHPKNLKFLELESSYSYTQGKLNNDRDLPFIAAPKIVSIINLKSAKRILLKDPFLAFTISNYLEQSHTPPYELATDSYMLLDIFTGGNLSIGKKNLSVKIFATNLLDKDYYSHLSLVKNIGVRDMGRNIGFKLGMSF